VRRELGKRRKKQKHGRRESLEGRLEQAKKKEKLKVKKKKNYKRNLP
jgi:hypothetical protein